MRSVSEFGTNLTLARSTPEGRSGLRETEMTDHVYKVIEIVGSSEASIEDAIQSAVTRASQTLRHLRWFEVIETRGEIADAKVCFYQVHLKVGFTMD